MNIKSLLSSKPSAAVLAVVVLLVLASVLGGVKALQIFSMIQAGKTMKMPPTAVSTTVAREENWQPSLPAVGTVRAAQGVDLAAEESGVVSKIAFENGARVQAGDLMVALDTRSEEARLRSAEAEARLAQISYDRAKRLRSGMTISQSEYDDADAQLRKANAAVEELRAAIEKKQLRAPFAGVTGIRRVNIGQFVAGGSPIVTLQLLEKVFVDFSLPQQQLSRLAVGNTVNVTCDAYPDRSFTGTLTTINPDVDKTTRNVNLQGTLPNPDGLLRPGMFVSVAVALPETTRVLVIPATAILYAPYGDSVFVAEESTDAATGEKHWVARQQFVRLDRALGDFVSVRDGLKSGDQVVSAGAFKLRNGMTLSINNTLAPKPELNPRPENM
jgi:membrane fusion protein (multidrug efflux system)